MSWTAVVVVLLVLAWATVMALITRTTIRDITRANTRDQARAFESMTRTVGAVIERVLNPMEDARADEQEGGVDGTGTPPGATGEGMQPWYSGQWNPDTAPPMDEEYVDPIDLNKPLDQWTVDDQLNVMRATMVVDDPPRVAMIRPGEDPFAELRVPPITLTNNGE